MHANFQGSSFKTEDLRRSECVSEWVRLGSLEFAFLRKQTKNSKGVSISKKAVDFLKQQKCRLSPNVIVVASESTNLL